MNSLIRSIGILILTCLLQVLIFRYAVFADGWVIICFHIYGLIMLPFELSKTSYILIGAVVGALMDVVLLTGGLHMAAGVFTCFMTPWLTTFIAPREGFTREHSISVLHDGWGRFLGLSSLISFTYMFSLFAVEGWKLSLLPNAIGKGVASTILCVILFSIVQGLFGPKPRSNSNNTSTYHW
jgi:hypothetical protein